MCSFIFDSGNSDRYPRHKVTTYDLRVLPKPQKKFTTLQPKSWFLWMEHWIPVSKFHGLVSTSVGLERAPASSKICFHQIDKVAPTILTVYKPQNAYFTTLANRNYIVTSSVVDFILSILSSCESPSGKPLQNWWREGSSLHFWWRRGMLEDGDPD